MPQPRWDALGLTHNPFENVRSGERQGWVSVPPAVAAAVSRRPFTVELIGEKGAGKSTLLKALAATLGAQYRYLDDRAPPEPLIPAPDSVWCLDEANNAPPRWVEAVGKAAAGVNASLLFGTHWSLAKQVPRLTTLALADHLTLDWVPKRVASATLPGATAYDFLAVAQSLSRTVRVTYAVQRVLYELAENLAWGGALPHALNDAVERAAADPTVAPWLTKVPRAG